MSSPKTPAPKAPESAKQVAGNPKSYAGEKVTVASKLPMALMLQLCEARTEQRRERATTWDEKVFHKVGPVVVVNGTAFPNADVPEDFVRPQMMAGFALTPGIDREFWEAWVEQNKMTPFVKEGLVFAHHRLDAVKSEARERRELDSNLGPIQHGKDKDGNPTVTDKRMPKKLSARVIRAAVPEEAALAE